MLKTIAIILWVLIITFIVIPINYWWKCVIVLLFFLWDFDTSIIKDIYWKGLETNEIFSKTKYYTWSEVYQFKFFKV